MSKRMTQNEAVAALELLARGEYPAFDYDGEPCGFVDRHSDEYHAVVDEIVLAAASKKVRRAWKEARKVTSFWYYA